MRTMRSSLLLLPPPRRLLLLLFLVFRQSPALRVVGGAELKEEEEDVNLENEKGGENIVKQEGDIKKGSRHAGLNHGPSHYKCDALTTLLFRQ